MVGWGKKLAGISTAALQHRLHHEEDRKAILRLIVALEYKHGTPVAEMATKYDIPRATVYDWLDRFEARGLDDALSDASPPGTDRALTEAQRREFECALRRSPADAGYEAVGWTPSLARRYVADQFDVDYSRRHVVRLLHEAGLEPNRGSRDDGARGTDTDAASRTVWAPVRPPGHELGRDR